MHWTHSRTIEILLAHSLIEERLRFDTETESRAIEECVTRARHMLLTDEDKWKEAWRLLSTAGHHAIRLEATAFFLSTAGYDLLSKLSELKS